MTIDINVKYKNIDETISVPEGTSIMEAIRFYSKDLQDSISADCGGNCACATCHVHIQPNQLFKVGRIEHNSMEDELLLYEHNQSEYSRLSCQIILKQEHNGISLTIPE